MKGMFGNWAEAGRLLAEALVHYAGRDDGLVLGLPGGGVRVAFEIARRLQVPPDVSVVRKLGVPSPEEYAFAAIATGGIRVVDEDVVEELHIPGDVIGVTVAREEQELRRRELAYGGHEIPPQIQGRIILLIDDGIATGSTMTAAVRAVRLHQPKLLVVAVPTASPSSCARLASEADEVVALTKPDFFAAVGQWDMDFSQTRDDEVGETPARRGWPSKGSRGMRIDARGGSIRKLASGSSHGQAPPETSGRPPVRAAGRLMPAMHLSNGCS
jgi:putative phosphoribosyl transferase